MGSITRKLKRQTQKNNGTLVYKKAVAKKLGISVRELNYRLAERDAKLKAMEENNNE